MIAESIICPVATGSKNYPDRPAIVFGDEIMTYSDLDRRVNGCADALQSLGVTPAMRVGLQLGDSAEFPVVLWALLRRGAVAVLLSDREPDASIASSLDATGCALVVTDRPIPSKVRAVHPGDLKRIGRSSPLPLLHPEQPATVVFTSGSEGRRKAVVHSLANHLYSAIGSQLTVPVDTTTRWAVTIPTYHVGGLAILFRCFLQGGTAVLVSKDRRHPTGLAELGVTHVSIVPTQLIDWLERPDRVVLSELKAILVGGAATPAIVATRARSEGFPIHVSYGSTEMSSQIATTDAGESEFPAGYVGRVLPHRKLRIRDGEIEVAGETRFVGYWDGMSITQPFDEDGWFATGDLGRLEGDRLFVTGRRTNLIISGGENISSEEVEDAILGTGLTRVALVVGKPDDRFGARPLAFVRPLCSLDELRAALTETLAPFKFPDEVRLLPPGMNGSKADRRALQQAVQPDETP